jgi:uncharacterized protein YodC (DUF2158 family)
MAIGNFKTGDIVVLKSGSENMTVEAYTDDGYVICTYWNDDIPVKTQFLEDELEIANDLQTPPDEFP